MIVFKHCARYLVDTPCIVRFVLEQGLVSLMILEAWVADHDGTAPDIGAMTCEVRRVLAY